MKKIVFHTLATFYVLAIFGLPLAVIAELIETMPSGLRRLSAVALAPVLFSILMVVVAGTLSLPHQKFIRPARLPRRIDNPDYFHRRLYGVCWTALYYTKLVYFLCLTFPPLKLVTFRLFGYKGGMNFTIYPDTWIRDLPLLTFGDGAYISNRATLGTNLVLGGSILVDRITVDRGALIGHLAMLAPGTHIGEDSEVGVGAVVGMRVRVGRRSSIGGLTGIERNVEIGDGVVVGGCSFLGAGALIANGVTVPRCGYVGPDQKVGSRAEADALHLGTDARASDKRHPG